jgi:hypothetical protein
MPYKNPESPEAIEGARASRRKHYYNNKEQYYRRNLERKHMLRDRMREAKNIPCTDCGIQYPYYVMDFDHVDSDNKTINISKIPNYGSIDKLEKEIAKCEVVCSNCHRERTYQRNGVGAGEAD